MFLQCRNCDSLAVAVVARFDLILLAAISPPLGELATVFVVCSFGLS